MTKAELVRALAEDFELPRKQVLELVESILERFTAALKSGDKVQLTPFGQFRVRDRAARVARNPQTGEPVNVPAKRVLKFIAGRTLKEAVGTAKAGSRKKSSAPAKKSSAPAKKTSAPAKKSAAKKVAVKKAPVRKAAPARKAAPVRKAAVKKTTGAAKKTAKKRR